MEIDDFINLRPFLWHVTAISNLEQILEGGILEPPIQLVQGEALLNDRRVEHLVADGALIRDQGRLFELNIEWQDGCDMREFLQLLNARVFFWPGDENSPIKQGLNFIRRYQNDEHENVAIKICSFQIEEDTTEFSKYNSGAPRCYDGAGSPRGPNTFQLAASCDYSAGRVVEVAFPSAVRLQEFEIVDNLHALLQ